jgi:hypothetical protein
MLPHQADYMADKLTELYQVAGRLEGKKPYSADHVTLLNGLIEAIQTIERNSGRAKRQRNIRKRERRAAREAAQA